MDNYLPINYLNHLIYCPRRFWYMYVQGEIEINAPMLEGSFQHQNRADKPGHESDDKGRTIHRRLWVWSDKLNIAGFADFVESIPHTSNVIPVEYKHGKKGQWQNDDVQLCAQALCLEEMTNQSISYGEIYYWRSRQRVTIQFDQTLRQSTEIAIQQAHQLLSDNIIPLPIQQRQKCKHCSLQSICLPDEVVQLTMSNQQ